MIPPPTRFFAVAVASGLAPPGWIGPSPGSDSVFVSAEQRHWSKPTPDLRRKANRSADSHWVEIRSWVSLMGRGEEVGA